MEPTWFAWRGLTGECRDLNSPARPTRYRGVHRCAPDLHACHERVRRRPRACSTACRPWCSRMTMSSSPYCVQHQRQASTHHRDAPPELYRRSQVPVVGAPSGWWTGCLCPCGRLSASVVGVATIATVVREVGGYARPRPAPSQLAVQPLRRPSNADGMTTLVLKAVGNLRR
jgi:hypothetical protein